MSELPSLEVGQRLERLRAAWDRTAQQLDALLVTRMPNVRYLTGFTGSAGMLLVGRDDALLVTDGRYGEQAAVQLAGAGCTARVEVRSTGQRELLAEALAAWAADRAGLEAHGVTWARRDELAQAFAPREVVATHGLVEELRRMKDAAELARVEAACAIADEAFAEVVVTLAQHPTEREVALALEVAMRGRGAERTSFDPIVASGPNAALPHARPTDRRIGRGEFIVMDFGCVVDGYCSDMTRTISIGDPGAAAREVYEVVLASQGAGCSAVAAGVECATVDAASRAVIEQAGFGDLFTHGTGHGVGLEIHEAPRVAATSDDTLAPGNVVTVEPGVYRPDADGVRIEDTVVVTAKGAELLTKSPKEPIL